MKSKKPCAGCDPAPMPSDGLREDERCPLCGGDNHCRMAKGHLYKGACWCQQVIVPQHLLARLAENHLEPACLCRTCLEAVARLAREGGDTESILAKIKKSVQG